jgi:uncharacterized protein (TIGR02145 family)
MRALGRFKVLAAMAVMLCAGCNDNGSNTPNYTEYYTLSIDIIPSGSGYVSRDPDNTTYRAGELVTVTAYENTGYEFVDWSGALNTTSRTVSVEMKSNVSLTANFRPRTGPQPGTTFTDSRDGKTYKKVTIGTQTWMAENLNYNASGSVCYGNSADSCAKYGRLYDWSTAMNGASSSSLSPSGVKGACPVGWHVPSDDEWTTLTDYAGGESTAGKKLKSTSGWYNNGNGTDDYGFTALPGGSGDSGGDFGGAGYDGDWWSATEGDARNARGRYMAYYSGEYVVWYNGGKTVLFSVRCVKDE